MATFNTNSRMSNALKTSMIGGITNIVKIFLGFGYRTIFVILLSEVYLGINGLFTNILQILSLAELGITTAIVFRFYEPISHEDVHYVGMLMNFFGKVYRTIACAILGIGLCLLPFINLLINNTDELPKDINIYIVYILFLLNTVVSYVYAYKLTLLTADQKNYALSVIDLILTIVRYGVQIIFLCVTHNYTVTLASGIVTTLIVNYIGSSWTQCQYKEVFCVKEMLPKEEQRKIFADTRACMYHKIGATVLTGTDNAVLTKMVSLAATGIYSNYSMVITYVQSFIVQILGNFTASVGNAKQNMSREEYYCLFKKINFSGYWVASVVTVSVYATLDDFIKVWLGEKFVMGGYTTVVLCILLYMTLSRIINGAFINADGLFVKDKVRPLIEAIINLVVSIVMAHYVGIVGVFLGTIISTLVTVQWRDPYILYKYSFKRSVWEYWRVFVNFFILTIVGSVAVAYTKELILVSQVGWGMVILEGLVTFIFINVCLIVVYRKSDEFSYIISIVKKITNKMLHHN